MILPISNVLNQIAEADPDLQHYQAGFATEIFSTKTNDDTPAGAPKTYPALLLNIASEANFLNGDTMTANLSLLFYMPATVTNAGTAQELSFVEARHYLEGIAQRIIQSFRRSGEESRAFTVGFPARVVFDVLKGRALMHVLEVVVPTTVLLDCLDPATLTIIDATAPEVTGQDLEKSLP